MEKDRSTQALNTKQFDQAVQILSREQQAYTISSRQEKIFKLFNLAIYGLGIVGSLFFLILIFSEIYFVIFEKIGWKDLWNLTLAVSIWGGILLLTVAIIPTAILSTGILVLFISNLGYIRQLLRHNKMIHRFGLKDALRAPWIKKTQKKRVRNIVLRCLRIIGLVFILFIGGMYILFFVSDEGYKDINAILLYIVIMLSIFACSSAIAANHIVQLSKERLKLISQLYSSMEVNLNRTEQEGGGGVQISSEIYAKIAQIERAQISRGRVQSILADMEESDTTPYVIQKSREAKDAQGSLDGATSLRVQEQIDALMTEPQPPGAAEDARTGRLKLHVPRTSVTIGYTVEVDSQRVRILSLETTLNAPDSTSVPGEGSQHV
jgi:hypothetical protein